MTSVQVDVTSLRTAAWQLAKAADDLAIAHDRASSVLDGDVPQLHGGAASQARDMMQEAMAACFRLGDSDRRLANALNAAADDNEHLEALLMAGFSPSHGS